MSVNGPTVFPRLESEACFIGTRIEALQSLRRFARVASILTPKDSWVHRAAEEHGWEANVVDEEDRETAFDFLRGQNSQLVLSAGFPFIIPQDVLEGGALFVNSHPSLLPAYKGRNAIKEAFKDGQNYTGVTVHHMVAAVDAGEIIAQERACVEGMGLDDIYQLLFGDVEPRAISLALTKLKENGQLH